jgi:hypothetical protein
VADDGECPPLIDLFFVMLFQTIYSCWDKSGASDDEANPQKRKKGEEGLFAFPIFHMNTLHFLPRGGQQ